jgi:cellulose synthase/poly-beta-1,6-N-acetylglucosamine synthase-like glycosyltransferase
VARRKFGQYFSAGAAGLVRETVPPVAQVARDSGINGGTRQGEVASDTLRHAGAQLNGKEQIRSRATSGRLRKGAKRIGVVSRLGVLNRLASACKRLSGRVLIVVLVLAAVSAAGLIAIKSPLLLYLLYLALSLFVGVVAVTTLIWMLHAWRTPDSLTASRLEPDGHEMAYSFSLIVPARHEEAVLETTLSRLISSDHPDFEVLVVVGADDPGTREVAERMASHHPERIRVIVDPSWPKSKPKALNAALPYCSATITGVFDAEDDVHPALLRRVDQCFRGTDADIVQAGVQLMNFRTSWYTVHNVLEYYFWFRSRLHVHARQRFIPLGGNTVFIRTSILRAVAGWADCLAEDCEIGVRLSALGARTAVFYEPELVTREECPPTLGAFIRQRTRWNQGYLQTLARGYWRRLPTRQSALGAYILASPYFMTLAWLMIPAAIATAVAVKAPIVITLMSFLPLLPMLAMLVVEGVGLAEFCRLYGQRRPSARDYMRLVLGLLVYQAVLAFAAAWAVVREARGVRGWEKTTHLGLHLGRSVGVDATSGTTVSKLPQRVAARCSAALGLLARPGAVLRRAIPGALPRSARKAWPAAPILPVLDPQLAEPALAETVVASHQLVEAQAYAPVSRAMARPAEDPGPHGHLIAWPTDARQAANGHDERRRSGSLFGTGNGEPLWARLDRVSANGSATGSPPNIPPASSARSMATRLGHIRASLATWGRSRFDLAVQIPLLIGLGYVQATNMAHWPDVLFDEGTYVGNAWAVGERGALAFYTYTYGHPPLGWVLITMWTSVRGLFGHVAYSLDVGREAMCAISIVSFSLLYTLARRLKMNPVFAAAAVIFFALCPLSLYFHRGAELDNPATVWAIAAFVLALSPRRRLWSFAGSGACFAASVLSKETTLVMLPALLLAAFHNTDARTRHYCIAVLIAFFSLLLLAFPLYATLKGELFPGPGHVSLIGTDINMLFTRQGTGTIFNSHSVARDFVMFWLNWDPWLLGAALLLSPIALAHRAIRPAALAFLIQVAMILRPGYLPEMYVIAMLPFAALVVAGSIQVLWSFAASNLTRRQILAGKIKRPVIGSRVAVRLRPLAVAASVLTIGVAAVATVHVVPMWARADRAAMTLRLDAPQVAAEQWLLSHVGHAQRIIVTDDFWVYLIGHGYDSRPVRGGFNSPTVVSYWPLDKDPAVRRYFPFGWREFNYVVANGAMRESAKNLPNTAQALAHSRLMATFGQGYDGVEIRAITPTAITEGEPMASQIHQFTIPVSANTPSLNQVAHRLGVSVDDIVTHTNQYPADPDWWYYLGRHNYGAPLPQRTILRYTMP